MSLGLVESERQVSACGHAGTALFSSFNPRFEWPNRAQCAEDRRNDSPPFDCTHLSRLLHVACAVARRGIASGQRAGAGKSKSTPAPGLSLDVLRLFGEGQTAAGSFHMAPSVYDQVQNPEYGAWVRKLGLLEQALAQSCHAGAGEATRA